MIKTVENIETAPALERFASQCRERLGERDIIVGIRTGGLALAQWLGKELGRGDDIGELDVNFHRDDFGRRLPRRDINPSAKLPPLDDARIVLVDDVLWTGRTIRAALNELFEFGRPRQVVLAILFDRPGRELPIQADIAGTQMDPGPRQQIKLDALDGKLSARLIEFAEPGADNAAK